jgi:hypothetical protein
MAGDLKGLKTSWEERTNETRRKADEAISELLSQSKPVNFSEISKHSGVSRNFLYKDEETRKKIEQLRQHEENKKARQRAKYDKTSNSKDVIIKAKDKRIAKLEEENRKLRDEIEHLRGKLYEMS